MSVPEYKRNESKVEYIENFHKMRKEINNLMLRDFGIKSKSNVAKLINTFSEEELASSRIDEALKERILIWKIEISNLMTLISFYIEQAYGQNIKKSAIPKIAYLSRIIYLDIAINSCNTLKDKFHEIMDVTDVKLGQYITIASLLKKEIDYLKEVKRSTERLYGEVLGNQ